MQAENDIRILCGEGSGECNIPQLAECKRNLSPAAAHVYGASEKLNQCATPKGLRSGCLQCKAQWLWLGALAVVGLGAGGSGKTRRSDLDSKERCLRLLSVSRRRTSFRSLDLEC